MSSFLLTITGYVAIPPIGITRDDKFSCSKSLFSISIACCNDKSGSNKASSPLKIFSLGEVIKMLGAESRVINTGGKIIRLKYVKPSNLIASLIKFSMLASTSSVDIPYKLFLPSLKYEYIFTNRLDFVCSSFLSNDLIL